LSWTRNETWLVLLKQRRPLNTVDVVNADELRGLSSLGLCAKEGGGRGTEGGKVMSVHGVHHSHGSCGANQANGSNSSNGTNSSGGSDQSNVWQEILAALQQQQQSSTQNGSGNSYS
jgi:hypothetical protein